MKTTPILILVALLMHSCVTAAKEEVAAANFGRLPADYQARVEKYMSTQIKLRPETATYEFTAPPRKAFYQSKLIGGTKRFGWVVPVKTRVKNHFGLHVSELRLVFLAADGTIEDCTDYFGQAGDYVD